MPSSALFIGRFQPFHLGHLSVIKNILQKHDFLVVGIGSAEESRTEQNPFTAGERWHMISTALGNEKIDPRKYAIIPIRDINDYNHWVTHVEKLVPHFDCIYTGSPLVKKLFKQHKKYSVLPVKVIKKISATQVREAIKKRENWEALVPAPVAHYLKQIKAPGRLKKI